MKLRSLLPLAGVLCTFLTAHAQPSPARQAFYEGACRISPRTMLCYETPLAPLAAAPFSAGRPLLALTPAATLAATLAMG